MREIIKLLILIAPIIMLIIVCRKVKQYNNLLEQCADMYPLHFEEMCFGK